MHVRACLCETFGRSPQTSRLTGASTLCDTTTASGEPASAATAQGVDTGEAQVSDNGQTNAPGGLMTTSDPPPVGYTPAEAAALCGVSIDTVRRYRKAGRFQRCVKHPGSGGGSNP
jgi:hypothetical protein